MLALGIVCLSLTLLHFLFDVTYVLILLHNVGD